MAQMQLWLPEINSRKQSCATLNWIKHFSFTRFKSTTQEWLETAHFLFTQLKKVLSVFKTLAFIDLSVIVQHTEEALKTPLMPSGSTPPWPTSLQPTPFFLISTDMFEAHVLGVDHCGVRSINSSALRLNRPHMSTKHTLPGIHRWVFAGEDHACSSRTFNPFTLIHIVKWDLICKFHLRVYVIFIFMPPHTFFCWLVL